MQNSICDHGKILCDHKIATRRRRRPATRHCRTAPQKAKPSKTRAISSSTRNSRQCSCMMPSQLRFTTSAPIAQVSAKRARAGTADGRGQPLRPTFRALYRATSERPLNDAQTSDKRLADGTAIRWPGGLWPCSGPWLPYQSRNNGLAQARPERLYNTPSLRKSALRSDSGRAP